VVATDIRAVPWPRKTVSKLSRAPAKTANISSEKPGDDGREESAAGERGDGREIFQERARSRASGGRRPRVNESGDADCGNHQAVQDGIPNGGIGEKLAVPIEREMTRRESRRHLSIERVKNENGDRR